MKTEGDGASSGSAVLFLERHGYKTEFQFLFSGRD